MTKRAWTFASLFLSWALGCNEIFGDNLASREAGSTSGAGMATSTGTPAGPLSPGWLDVDSMSEPRSWPPLVQLADHTVLAAGGGSGKVGDSEPTALDSAEIYLPEKRAWTTVAKMGAHRAR